MMKIPFLIASIVLAIVPSAALASTSSWLTDFDAARKLAAQQKKDLYVNFTGSDW